MVDKLSTKNELVIVSSSMSLFDVTELVSFVEHVGNGELSVRFSCVGKHFDEPVESLTEDFAKNN